MALPIFLKNGERVKINDHVYCSPSWAVRDGTPYSVARIMEFLGPEGAPKGNDGKLYHQTRVRLAWYYRPSDVSDRPVADSRLLLAAIYSEVCDINQLRAKCYVIHRDKITDLAGWKKRPDRFYFNRLFDPYIKKEFEVIQSTDVRNLPDDIRNNLTQRYEYVVAEKEVIPDLTDSLRLCEACHEWCPSPETVQCDRCKKFFHMGCVQPPLLAKPSRGYGWTCAPCSKRHEEEVDSHEVRHTTPAPAKPKSNAPAPRGRGRPRKDRQLADKEENLPIKHYQGWPFRYFGQYTVAEDTLDPDDLIFPRTTTRVGAKFQANIPQAPGINSASTSSERGGESTVEILSVINMMSETEVAVVETCKTRLTEIRDLESSVDWLTEVIRRFSDAYLSSRPLATVSMNSPLRLEKWKKQETRYTDRMWSTDEIAAFEDGILAHGAELRAVKDDVGTRSMPEVVRFYGHWKNARLGEENACIRESGAPQKPVWRAWENDYQAHRGQHVGLADDEGSIVDQPSKGSIICGACRARESQTWWKAPKGLPTNILCDVCGQNWRKYADLNVRPLREESVPSGKAKMPEKREGTPLAGPGAKRARTSASIQSTPPPNHSAIQQIRCLACQKNGPLGKVLKCKKCQFRVHAGCCGVVIDPAEVDSWLCDLCQNDQTLEASLNPDCLLCPREQKEEKKKSVYPPPDTYLRASKPTEGQGWAHVLCSVFIPELRFTDSSRLRLVEGISMIPQDRWSTICVLCHDKGGAVIRCSDCVREYHASCAWKHGHKFGFEIQPVKSSRRDTTTITTFKGESGCMNPVVSCKEHDRTRRDIYDICETNEGGETALQVYCQFYKQAQVGQAHALLRKARRLDHVLTSRVENSPQNSDNSQSVSVPQCFRCRTLFSPCFHEMPPDHDVHLCHKCHFEGFSQGSIDVSLGL